MSSNFILSESFHESVSGKRIYLDNDFVCELYYDKELLNEFVNLTIEKSSLIIDPLTEFEFLRSIYADVDVREEFIHQEIFIRAINHHEIFKKIQDNALILSKIYAQHGVAVGKSPIDLFLAGRVMIDPLDKTRIITRNKKDFPSCIFDIDGLMSKVSKDETIKTYSLLCFNQESFLNCQQKLTRVK